MMRIWCVSRMVRRLIWQGYRALWDVVGDEAVQLSGADHGCLRMKFYWLANDNH